ncbi:cysteine-rich with EGF-like domain protein 2 [Pseudoliparis swirei]|uniref:cysteine-rich with EGF-like domain protein 2 n=1 Tax=Pseudoliparis swirei TaxID=2059687 RepID=UPI0024BE065C|nr:cysteine-rich with EGF-like domain protein 2 [Pseudoliparis swirei]
MLPAGPQLQLLRLLSCVTVILLFQVTSAKKDLKSACNTCQQVTDNFNKGFERTANQNFGGGNTAWEERTLAKYETSEIRLMEILEGVCDSSSFECNRMLEEHEDHFETWWFKRKTKHPDLHKWFCIDAIRTCCPNGTFGPDCKACVGGSEWPCHGNGQCDGNGTRGGDGKCSCDAAYEGDSCLDCIGGYFNEVRNDTFSLCTACHTSCKTCTGATSQDCDECKDGWEDDDQEACVDVNECSAEASPCGEEQYCVNTDGSYSCAACDSVCSGCTGAGADKCRACAGGYEDAEGTCTDIDECSQPEPVCTEEHEQCVNTQGSHVCSCSSGYEEQEGECVPTLHPEKEEESEASGTTTDGPHEEL